MPEGGTIAIEGSYGDLPVSRRTYVISALIYPFWHLAAPPTATDPWGFWWAVASTFLIVDLTSRRIPFVARHVGLLFHLCAALCTVQLYVLASVNDMSNFYVVGSVMSVLATSVSIRSKRVHLAYGVFVAVLSIVLIALHPEARKAAYWGGMLTIIAASYYRLSAQLTAAQLIREHRERLEERVRERTSELFDANRRLRREMEKRTRLEEELRVSQKLEAVGRLAGGVAHEFNNLLTRIRLYAELALEKSPAEAEISGDIEEIQKAGHQAGALTRQLLTFSRRGEVETVVLDLNEVLEESSTMLRHLLGESTELVVLLGDGPHRIRVDRGQLDQVLVNLVLNARDAMVEGGRFTIETSVVRRGDDGARDLPGTLREDEYVLLAVSDTGVGMDSETRARAFDPFFTRKPVNRGTGLGLSIVYGILNQAGGHVRVLSEPGKGTRFELLWPRTQELPTRSRIATSLDPLRRGSERILLVEDEADLRGAMARLLTSGGYTVLEAGGPEAALAIAESDEGPIHLLLTDVVMPNLSGVDLAEAICASRPETRVLLISGYMDLRGPLERDWPPGVAFLAKPFASADLAAKVREVLDAPAAVPDTPPDEARA